MMIKRTKRILLVMIVGVGVILFIIVLKGAFPPKQTQAEQIAERIIFTYMKAKGLDMRPGTEAYASLMKGILLGEHPDLTGEDSIFVPSNIERDYVIAYAAAHIKTRDKKDYKEPTIEEAPSIRH